ncbi:RING-H2 finger protein ATL57-like [Papaver somniferum]|uniref:RING-H2 finger protein ATL57-like n=1 Tax=Papaver somniferum TaxID=3469 RepID=UPI000E703E7E|nr:RING-H2 finger protein ATL57-like [Papaver somniferum]
MKIHSRKLFELIKNDEEYFSKTNITSTATPVSSTSKLEAADDTTIDDSTETPPTKPGLSSPTQLGFDTSMALTVLVLLTALFFMVFFSMYLRRFAADDQNSLEISARRRRQLHRRSNNNSRLSTSTSSSSNSLSVRSNRQSGLDSLTIKSLPMFAYEHGNSSSQGEAAEESIDCVVCLSEFEERETVKMIPYCGHVFHPECIDTWFSSHVSCPLCRSTKLFSPTSTDKDKNHDDIIIMMMMIDKQCRLDRHQQHQLAEDAVEGSVIRNDDTCVAPDRSVVPDRGLEGSSHMTRNNSWPKMQIDKGSTPALTRSSSF